MYFKFRHCVSPGAQLSTDASIPCRRVVAIRKGENEKERGRVRDREIERERREDSVTCWSECDLHQRAHARNTLVLPGTIS